jgi:hypothetical protein
MKIALMSEVSRARSPLWYKLLQESIQPSLGNGKWPSFPHKTKKIAGAFYCWELHSLASLMTGSSIVTRPFYYQEN